MMFFLKKLIKNLLPKRIFHIYHSFLTLLSAWRYGFPSRKMIVVAVTGTNGKSTTCILITRLLQAAGLKVGLASSVLFKVGEREWINTEKMTMLGRGKLQSLLSQMVQEGCTHAVIEVSSEGLAQGRLSGIDVDVAVFTNLTPEHIESHGSFEQYKKAKGKLFSSLKQSYIKVIRGIPIPKVIVANTDDEHAPYYLDNKADSIVGFGVNTFMNQLVNRQYQISNIVLERHYSRFLFNNVTIETGLEGQFNVYNAAAAYVVVQELGIPIQPFKSSLRGIHGLPGRMEWIEEGQDYGVLVDYAPEPASLHAVYEYIKHTYSHPRGRIIHVLGSAGGGRDVARRPVLGTIAGENADIVIVTNEDPYDEDPQMIIEQVATGARSTGKKINENLFMIQDRKKAIIMACSMAKAGDIVLLTGKGAEQAIMGPRGTKIVWDERTQVREAIHQIARN